MDLGQVAVRELLFKKLNDGKTRNAAFSIRALARQVDLQPGALSEILAGKRRISKKLAARIILKLGVGPDKREEALKKFEKKIPEFSTPKHRLVLEADKHAMIADWFYFAILSLFETENCSSDPQWIASRLKIPQATVRTALHRLQRLGLIVYENDKVVFTGSSVSSPDQSPNEALRHVHRQNLSLAERSLDAIDINFRDFSAITLAIDPEKIPAARKKIRSFLKDMEQLLEVAPKREVYKLCVQLFPLTNLEKGSQC